jgi:hypothetical protein
MEDNREVEFKIRFVANSPEKREKGLMHANPLDEDEIVLFVFPNENNYSFWNKNVPFDLSLAFLDENGKIINMKDMDALSERSVCADSYNIKHVIEAKKGAFDNFNIKKGDIFYYKDSKLLCKRAG